MHTLLESCVAVLGGRTNGTPKHCTFGHSSPSIAQPCSKRLPSSAEAMSDCSRRRRLSSVSGGKTKIGELRPLETSVGGVEVRVICDADDALEEDDVVETGGRLAGAVTVR